MPPTAFHNRLLTPLVLLLGLLTLAGCRDAGISFAEPEAPAGRCSIAWLKGACRGESTLVTADWVVEGRIVANDAYGEWSRSVVLSDASGGITLFAAAGRLADRYPFGASVRLYLNGLRLYDYGGKIIVGAADPTPYADGTGFDFAVPEELVAAHLHRLEDAGDPPVAQRVTLDAIGPDCIDRYVRIEEVYFVEADEGLRWCDRDPETGRHRTTERTIADSAGRTLRVRTLGGCLYADEPLPQRSGSLCGVIDYFNGSYSLRVVNREIAFPE